jgi:hypothetical protein
VILSTALLTEGTSGWLMMTTWSRMAAEAAKAPYQTAAGL